MPRLIDTQTRTGTLVAAINEILAEGGAAALSLRRIAEVSRVSTSSILHHFGSRERLVVVAAHKTGGHRAERLAMRAAEGPFAFLPFELDDIQDARTWLAWQGLWRCDESIGRVVHEARLDERALFARALDFRVAGVDFDGAWALVDGLTAAICAPRGALSASQARSVLAAHLHRLDVTPAASAVSSS